MINKKLLKIPGITVTVLGLLFVLWVYYLRNAHSSFEKYYAFRGCKELVERTDAYARCKLTSGQIIKLVEVDSKWYLDGDLGMVE